MIPRPTTDTLVQDCCRELTEQIMPAITDDTLKVRLIMAVTVLENAAVRAAHEIAWMVEESAALVGFAEQVAAVHPDDRIASGLDEVSSGSHDSLHLSDVVDGYERAGRAFDIALKVAHEAGAEDLVRRGTEILRARVDTEKVVMGGYAVVGR
jgi:hypothetical protein